MLLMELTVLLYIQGEAKFQHITTNFEGKANNISFLWGIYHPIKGAILVGD